MRKLIAYIGLIAMAGFNADAQPADANTSKIINDYTDAYNARDLDAMAALMHPDVQWLSINGDSLTIVANGKNDLVGQMSAFFAGPSNSESTLDGIVANNPYIAVRETAHWQSKDGAPASQSALAVYEIEASLVRRVWYFPETR